MKLANSFVVYVAQVLLFPITHRILLCRSILETFSTNFVREFRTQNVTKVGNPGK